MNTFEKILESTEYVVNNAEEVKINNEKLLAYAKEIAPKVNNLSWVNENPFNLEELSEEKRINLMLTFNSLSFSYWGEPYWTKPYKGQKFKRGSWSLIGALLTAEEEGIPILDANYKANISLEEVTKVLTGSFVMPMIQERWNILRDTGSVLVEKYKGDFRNMIDAAKGDGAKFVDLIVNDFVSFKDTAEYKGKKIYFCKRAQATAQSFPNLIDASKTTALADYVEPAHLRSLRIFEYGNELSYLIDSEIELKKGSKFETEIRSSNVQVVKRITDEINKTHPNVIQSAVNDYLWLYGRDSKTPFHRCRTTAY